MPSAVLLGFLLTLGVASSPVWAQQTETQLTKRSDPSADLIALDAAAAEIVSEGPSAKIIKNLETFVRGERLVANATTDVWAHEGFAYTGTFGFPCGGDPDAGVWIWNVEDPEFPSFVGVIPSPDGSRSNDVKVARMNSGDILVHSNERCGFGGPGGFEIYSVDDPTNPVHLASVRIDELNPIANALFGGISDVGVHNLFLFTQYGTDYVAAVSETAFGNFMVFDINDPANPAMVAAWGAEEIFDPGVGAETANFGRVLDAVLWMIDGYGASSNRFLHDVTISADGMQAYLANWDAGLVLLDISDVTNPQLVSVALDPTSEDGEVNSHAVWPSEDGAIVVESEEDFAPYDGAEFSITSGPNSGAYPVAEGAITAPLAGLPGSTMSGATTYVGLACTGGDPVPSGNGIALIQRGVCEFSEKINNAEAAGYFGVVVFNDEARGNALVQMGGNSVNLPGVFVGHSTGLAIAGVASAADLVIGAAGESISASNVPNGWGGLRIWDYSDPANPVLASTFNTVCSANPVDPSCDPAGTYSVHNVIVETTGQTTKAYVSWYSEGMLVLDVTDPYNPVEVARFFDSTQEFLDSNGGNPHSFWGVYKVPRQPWIYGSDRNGGLYLFKELGAPTKGRRGR